jgi:hypothetical protein
LSSLRGAALRCIGHAGGGWRTACKVRGQHIRSPLEE